MMITGNSRRIESKLELKELNLWNGRELLQLKMNNDMAVCMKTVLPR